MASGIINLPNSTKRMTWTPEWGTEITDRNLIFVNDFFAIVYLAITTTTTLNQNGEITLLSDVPTVLNRLVNLPGGSIIRNAAVARTASASDRLVALLYSHQNNAKTLRLRNQSGAAIPVDYQVYGELIIPLAPQ